MEKDLGIMVHTGLEANRTVYPVCEKGSVRLFSMIKRHFKETDKEDFKKVYRLTLTRGHISSPTQSPNVHNDRACL